MDLDVLTRTRRSLHGVAEGVLAGPQYRESGTIRLRATGTGFATVKTPALAVDGTDLLAAGSRIPLGGTHRGLAAAAGVDWGPPEGLYHDHRGAEPHDEVVVDPAAARVLAGWFARGDAALRRVAEGATPVLWPEHFDLAVTVDEMNLGVSPGDSWSAEPYAYVGPWEPRRGDFWNAPFGAARPMSALPDVDALAAFFTEGHRLAVAG
jgi:hypothetical protein